MTLHPNRCVILVPVQSHIEAQCEDGLRELERRGYEVWRIRGFAAIDQARNRLAYQALERGFEETFWIDSDIAFSPDDVDRIRSHELPLCSGIYPKKGQRALASRVLPGTKSILFGSSGGLIEIMFAATGFLHVRRFAYETIKATLGLHECNQRFGEVTVPYFQPLVIPDGVNGHLYLAEDYAFSERARQCGFKIIADTVPRLSHIGVHGFSWEEAGSETTRYAEYRYQLG